MKTLEATYRIVTPMFLGDADQKATEIRPPSVKGALRFWWRALNWAACLRDSNRNAADALRLLHQREARLFGSAATDKAGGQSLFFLRVEQEPYPTEQIWPKANTGSGYLGYGLFESGRRDRAKPHRQGIAEGRTFSARLIFKSATTEEDIRSLTKTLQVFGLCGGLGSRSRRGFGSVSLCTLNGKDQLPDASAYREAVTGILKEANGVQELPPYTAFSRLARHRILADGTVPRDVHAKAGEMYRQHRGQPSSLRGRQKIPFGLPLENVDKDHRRASPLLFHIQELKGKRFCAAVLFLPAVFHPEFANVQFTDVERFAIDQEVRK